MAHIRVSSVRWALGLFIFVVGALMMVAPHQFNTAPYSLLRSQAVYWGLAFLISGLLLIFITMFRTKQWVVIAIHLLGSLLIFFLASGFVLSRNWVGGLLFIIFGFGLLLAAIKPGIEDLQPSESYVDLFAILTALTFIIGSFLVLFHPSRITPLPVFTFWMVLFSIVAGLLLIVSQFILYRTNVFTARKVVQLFVWGPYYLVAILLFLYLASLSVSPSRFWVPALYYGIFGMVLALYPTLHTRFPQLNPIYLRTRLAVILSATVIFPLIITVALISNREEAAVKAEALFAQEREAATLARATSSYIGLHRSALNTLAAQPGLMDLSPEMQQAVMRQYSAQFSGAIAFALFSEDGTPVVRSDEASGLSIAGFPIYEIARESMSPSFDILISPIYQKPVFAFGAPVIDSQNQFTGIVSTSILAESMYNFLISHSAIEYGVIFLVDPEGHVIAHQEAQVVSEFSSQASNPAVAAFLESKGASGQATYLLNNQEQLVGFSRVPELGWGVIFDRPAEYALSTVYAWRDTAFLIAIISIMIISILGIFIANLLIKPLDSLAQASEALAAGNMSVPLPESQIREINHLAVIFGQMRSALHFQTQERLKTLNELERAKINLEIRVAERTEELRLANRDLKMELEERKKAEARAEQLAIDSWQIAEELGTIFSSMIEAVVVYDDSGKPVRANRAAQEMYGFDPVEVLPQKIGQRLRLCHPDGRLVTEAEMIPQRALQGESVYAQRYVVTHQDGQHRMVMASGAPIFLDNVISGAVVVWHDVTEREIILLELENERAKLKAIFENAPEGIIVIDKEGSIILTNPAFERIYQRPLPANLLSNSSEKLELYYPQGKRISAAELPLMASLSEGIYTSNTEFFTVNPGGTKRMLLLNTAPILDPQMRINGSMMIVHDVTVLKENEEAIRKNMAKIEVQQRLMEHLDAERSHIARDLHDGPLQELIGLSFSFSQIASELENTAQAEHMERVQLYLQQQIEDLRRFSTDLRPPVLSHFGLEKAIRSHLDLFREKYPDIEVKSFLQPDGQNIPESVRTTVFRIFRELIYNALQHANADQISVWFNHSEQEIQLVVKDNGCGFNPPENWIDLARQGQFGLVSIRERVMDIGGSISLESLDGLGTTVKVTIPFQPADVDAVDNSQS